MIRLIKQRCVNAIRAVLPSRLHDVQERYFYRRRLGLIHFAPWRKYKIYGSTFGKRCRLGGSCIIRNTTFGDYSYAETGVRISETTIGRFCSIGPGVMIGLAGHPVEKFASTHPAFYLNQPALGYDLIGQDTRSDYTHTTLGSDVWIGANAMIKDGITIGDGAIVGAGAVVTKDVEPYTIVAGMPARPIRKRFDDQTIEALLQLRWWDRGEEWIREHTAALTDVDELVALWERMKSDPALASPPIESEEGHRVS